MSIAIVDAKSITITRHNYGGAPSVKITIKQHTGEQVITVMPEDHTAKLEIVKVKS